MKAYKWTNSIATRPLKVLRRTKRITRDTFDFLEAIKNTKWFTMYSERSSDIQVGPVQHKNILRGLWMNSVSKSGNKNLFFRQKDYDHAYKHDFQSKNLRNFPSWNFGTLLFNQNYSKNFASKWRGREIVPMMKTEPIKLMLWFLWCIVNKNEIDAGF